MGLLVKLQQHEHLNQQFMVCGVDGWAEWSDNRECLNLDFFWVDDGAMRCLKALLPHGRSELSLDEVPSIEHVQGAKAGIARMSSPEVQQNGGFLRRSERGYFRMKELEGSPVPFEQWPSALELRSREGFSRLLQGTLSLWDTYPTFMHQELEATVPAITGWLNSAEVQAYLRVKATNMADYWAEQIGEASTSGDATAGALREELRSKQPVPNPSEILRFKEAMIEDAMQYFSNHTIPSYQTGYGIQEGITRILKRANLMQFEERFPWQTWQPFDFSDAPRMRCLSW